MLDNGVGNLIKRSARTDGHVIMNGVNIGVLINRTDVLGVDVRRITSGTIVTNESGANDLLVQHNTHLALHPCNNVQIGDVDNVVTIDLLQLVNSLRSGGTREQREDLLDLLVALLVTTSTSLILGNVCRDRLDASKRSLTETAPNLIDPGHLTRDKLGILTNELGLGIQNLKVLDAMLNELVL